MTSSCRTAGLAGTAWQVDAGQPGTLPGGEYVASLGRATENSSRCPSLLTRISDGQSQSAGPQAARKLTAADGDTSVGPLQQVDCGLRAGGGHDLMTVVVQDAVHDRGQAFLAFGQEDQLTVTAAEGGAVSAAWLVIGSKVVTVVPMPGSE